MKLVKEIKSKEDVVHFRRWQILSTRWFSINIHGIYQSDQDEHMHNHPWNIWTMVLKGSYIEELYHSSNVTILHVRERWHMAYRNSEQFHKIKKLRSPMVYTLAIMGKRKEAEWGYITDNGFIDHITYRKNKRSRQED